MTDTATDIVTEPVDIDEASEQPTTDVGDTAGIDPDERWGVRLWQRTGGDTPEEAVDEFIDRIADFGLRGYTYIVEDRLSGEVHYVTLAGEDGRTMVAVTQQQWDDMMADAADPDDAN